MAVLSTSQTMLSAAAEVMAQKAVASMSDFFEKQGRCEDKALLAKLFELQGSGAWHALAGRTARV